MVRVRDLALVRKAFSHELGSDVIAELHTQNRLYDVATMIAFPAVNALLAIYLGTRPLGPLWIMLFVLQGAIIPGYLALGHDLFMHRKVGGKRLSMILGFVYFLPILFPFAWFVPFHRQHHKYVGSAMDAEEYKQDLDTVWKRILFMTFPGVQLLMSRRLAAGKPDPRAVLQASPEEHAQIRLQRLLLKVYTLTMLILAVKFRIVLLGIVAPFVLISPIMSSIRVLLEHGEANPDSDYHTGTFHTPNWGLQLIFLFSNGEGHMVHHVYQGIPWYHLPRASRLMRPIFIREGCVFRSSLVELLMGWFSGQPHRNGVWNLGPAAIAAGDRPIVQRSAEEIVRQEAVATGSHRSAG